MQNFKLNPDQIRQGDVLLVRVEKRPTWAIEAKRDEHGRVVIAHGESSGHAHAFHGPATVGFRAQSREMAAFAGLDYIEIGGAAPDELKHEYADGRWTHEHKPVIYAPGKWMRGVQVDEDDEGVREVQD